MDIAQARTFLEIAESGSFVAAAGHLNITQTAVSARIHTLEEQLGRRLFVRNKSGARLTPAGERFLRHARTLVQVWDRARAQVGLPEGRTNIVSVGAEVSLWDPILADWLVWMRHEAPDIALRAEVGVPAQLLEAVHSGALDLAVLYDPPTQPAGIVVELLHEDKLVLVTTATDGQAVDYVAIDWGSSFTVSHQAAFPQQPTPDIAVSHGPLALAYLIRTGGTGYFRLSAVRPYLEAGRLLRVPDAPEFAYSMHMVHSSRVEEGLMDLVRLGFRRSAVIPAPEATEPKPTRRRRPKR